MPTVVVMQYSTEAPTSLEDPKLLHNYPVRPCDPKVQGRSVSLTRMDSNFPSRNEKADSGSDVDEELERVKALFSSKMKLVPDESLSSISASDCNRKNTVEFNTEPIVHEIERNLNVDAVPTSVQIHRAVEPISASQRMRKSVGGTLHCQVHFHQVQIRKYPMIAGDNPACPLGAPVQLGWEYEELPALDLDDFEAVRCLTRRQQLHHLILNYYQRNHILQGVGYTDEEIIEVEKEVGRDRLRRDMTQLVVPFWRVEDFIQSVYRKLKRQVNKVEKEKKKEFDRMIQMLRERDALRL